MGEGLATMMRPPTAKIILRMMTSHRRYRRQFERLQAVYGTQTRAGNPLYASK